MPPFSSWKTVFGSGWAEPNQGGQKYQDADDTANIHIHGAYTRRS